MQTHLLERDFLCPNCARKIQSLDKLIVDKPMRARVHDYIDQEMERSRQEAERQDRQAQESAEAAKAQAQAEGATEGGDKVRVHTLCPRLFFPESHICFTPQGCVCKCCRRHQR